MRVKDIRVFYNDRSRSWVIANDYKLRRLMNEGYSLQEAKHRSHGHLNSKATCEKMKANILANRKTKSRDLWILGCYVRICDKNTYKQYHWVCGLYATRKRKGKQSYMNEGGRKR